MCASAEYWSSAAMEASEVGHGKLDWINCWQNWVRSGSERFVLVSELEASRELHLNFTWHGNVGSVQSHSQTFNNFYPSSQEKTVFLKTNREVTVHTLSQISDDDEDPRLAQTQFHSHHPPPLLVTDNRSEIIVATERTGVMWDAQ